ncbi:hypothetical protein CDAR_436311 [Caerostris darwini]|uniref:Uncharacterized protein n=1 Tax=Caerostris darwini TaxID=1538125 RepID=A0AAV4RBJ9_9ARAC|nr:hypothetical protein CDAR_436311 [Caerostris darwini]
MKKKGWVERKYSPSKTQLIKAAEASNRANAFIVSQSQKRALLSNEPLCCEHNRNTTCFLRHRVMGAQGHTSQVPSCLNNAYLSLFPLQIG